uniref:Uncharacterized protein n=1 Tax=Anguilla anguilla TaxID=7936 RepID=A0A0E9UJF5_ANGAN
MLAIIFDRFCVHKMSNTALRANST